MSPEEDHLPAQVVELRVGRVIEERTEPTRVPRLWSARAISSRWELSRMQVYRAHRNRRLPGYRVLGTLRFLEEDVIALLREEGVPVGERGASS